MDFVLTLAQLTCQKEYKGLLDEGIDKFVTNGKITNNKGHLFAFAKSASFQMYNIFFLSYVFRIS